MDIYITLNKFYKNIDVYLCLFSQNEYLRNMKLKTQDWQKELSKFKVQPTMHENILLSTCLPKYTIFFSFACLTNKITIFHCDLNFQYYNSNKLEYFYFLSVYAFYVVNSHPHFFQLEYFTYSLEFLSSYLRYQLFDRRNVSKYFFACSVTFNFFVRCVSVSVCVRYSFQY